MRVARVPIRAETLQWFGLVGAGLIWAGQHVVGFGTTLARCSVAGSYRWDISFRTWEIVLTAVAAALVLVAEAAAVTVLRATWGVEDDGEPPVGRRHFFAVAAVLGNVLFLNAILLSGLGSIVFSPCRQG